MPQPAIQFDPQPRPGASRAASGDAQPVVVTLATGDLAWTASPARQLHDRLLESFSYPAAAAAEKTLSRRQRLAILVGATAFLWSLIGATAAAIAIR